MKGSPIVESSDRELDVLRLLSRITSLQDEVHDFEKILKVVARGVGEVFDGADACFAILDRRGDGLNRWTPAQPEESERRELDEYVQGRGPALTPLRMFVPVSRHGRRWSLLVVRGRRAPFQGADFRVARRIAKETSKVGVRLDRLRYLEVRSKIDRKVIRRLSPKDLFYQILHGLESLTEYDHSAAFLTHHTSAHEDAAASLEVVAERLVWKKEPSPRIGQEFAIGSAADALLRSGTVLGLDRDDDAWTDWDGRDVTDLARALDYNLAAEGLRERTILCAPLVSEGTVLGVLKIASTEPGSFGPWEAELVKGFLPHTAVAVANLEVLEGMRRRLETARHFQESLLPARDVRTEHASLAFRIEAWEHLGGDFVDVPVDRYGDLTFLIADVSGHGAEAAMLTALVKSAFQDERSDRRPPLTVIQRIGRAIRFIEAQFFITAICARYRHDEGILEWVNAGHPSGLTVSPDGITEELDQTGIILSPALEGEWEVRERKLAPGSRVFLYTDGITEAEGATGEFGEGRLARMVSTSSAGGQELLAEVLDAVERHTDHRPPEDDLTLLTVRVE